MPLCENNIYDPFHAPLERGKDRTGQTFLTLKKEKDTKSRSGLASCRGIAKKSAAVVRPPWHIFQRRPGTLFLIFMSAVFHRETLQDKPKGNVSPQALYLTDSAFPIPPQRFPRQKQPDMQECSSFSPKASFPFRLFLYKKKPINHILLYTLRIDLSTHCLHASSPVLDETIYGLFF